MFERALGLVFVLALVGCGDDGSDSPGGKNDAGEDGASGGSANTGGSAGSSGSGGSDAGVDAGPLGFCGTPIGAGVPSAAPAPATGAPLNGVELFDGWKDARALAAPVNSVGPNCTVPVVF